MAQILKGTTYTSGGTVTDANLNNLVDNATLQADAIDAQTDRPVLATSDTFLVTSGATLKKVTLANLLKVSPIIGGTTPAAVTATTLASTTLTTSGLATVGLLTSTGLATAGSLSVGGTSAHTGAATFASTAAFTGAATFDVAPNFNGGANLGNLDADPVVMTCTLSGNPILSLGSPVTAVAADKVLIQDADDASKLKLAAFPLQYIKAAALVDVLASSPFTVTILGASLNVASVSRTSLGLFRVTWTTPFANANYVVNVTPHIRYHTAGVSDQTATYVDVAFVYVTINDADIKFSIVAFGGF